MAPEEVERRRVLAVVAVELAAEVTRLAAATDTQSTALDELTASTDKAKRRTTIKIRVLVALFVADIALTAAIYVFYNNQAEASARLERLTVCQARNQAESRAGLAARSNFADVSTDADLQFLDAQEKAILGSPNNATQAQRNAARTDWLTAIQNKRQSLLAAKQVRADNPIDPAHEDC